MQTIISTTVHTTLVYSNKYFLFGIDNSLFEGFCGTEIETSHNNLQTKSFIILIEYVCIDYDLMFDILIMYLSDEI